MPPWSEQDVRAMVDAAVEIRLAAVHGEFAQWFEHESRALSLANRQVLDSGLLVDAQRINSLESRLSEGMVNLEAKVDGALARLAAGNLNSAVDVPPAHAAQEASQWRNVNESIAPSNTLQQRSMVQVRLPLLQ